MKQINFNVQTGLSETVDVPDVVYPDMPVEQPTVEGKITDMAVQLTATQKQLDTAQDALDFILIGGM